MEPFVLQLDALTINHERRRLGDHLQLALRAGDRCAIVEPGAARSRLAAALAGLPGFRITSGRLLLDGADITPLDAGGRARHGLWFPRQPPDAVPGETVASWLRATLASQRGAPVPPSRYRKLLLATLERLGLDSHFAGRGLSPFTPRDAWRFELLQTALVAPRVALFDACTLVDIDAWKVLADGLPALGERQAVLLFISDPRALAFAPAAAGLPLQAMFQLQEGRLLPLPV